MTDCFRCGGPAVEQFGNAYLCAECIPDDSGDDTGDDAAFDTTGDHENPVDVADVTDAERAAMLREYLETFVDAFGEVPRLMPLDDEGKAPVIQGECRLDSPEGRSYLVDGEEAIRQIREEGARVALPARARQTPEHTTPLTRSDGLRANRSHCKGNRASGGVGPPDPTREETAPFTARRMSSRSTRLSIHPDTNR